MTLGDHWASAGDRRRLGQNAIRRVLGVSIMARSSPAERRALEAAPTRIYF
jgi:hypothetical protein